MFSRASWNVALRAAATLGVAATVSYDLATSADGNFKGALLVEVVVAARTAGNVTVLLRGSVDGTTYFDLPNGGPGSGGGGTAGAPGAPGPPFLRLNGPVPRFLRAVSPPAGGFDGTLALNLRSDSGIYST